MTAKRTDTQIISKCILYRVDELYVWMIGYSTFMLDNYHKKILL